MDIKYKIIIMGDSHLNRQIPQEIALFRIKAHNDAFIQVVDFAIKNNINAILHCGDLFDIKRPWPTVVELTKEQLYRLDLNKIDFFCIKGNHEGGGTEKKFIQRGCAIEYANFPSLSNFYFIEPILDIEKAEELKDKEKEKNFPVGYRDFKDIRIWGCGYYGRQTQKIMEKIFDNDLIKEKFSILLLHCFVEDINNLGFKDETIIPASEIEKYQFNIVALGHNHSIVEPIVRKKTTFLSPGSTEMWDFFKPVGFGFYVLTIYEDYTFDFDYKKIDPTYCMRNFIIKGKEPKSSEWYEQTMKRKVREVLSKTTKDIILNFQLKGKITKDSPLIDCDKIRIALLTEKRIIYINIDDRINLDLDIVDTEKFKSGISMIQIEELLKENLSDEEVLVLIDVYNNFNKELDNEDSLTKTGNLKSNVFDDIQNDLEEKLISIEIREKKKGSSVKEDRKEVGNGEQVGKVGNGNKVVVVEERVKKVKTLDAFF